MQTLRDHVLVKSIISRANKYPSMEGSTGNRLKIEPQESCAAGPATTGIDMFFLLFCIEISNVKGRQVNCMAINI